MQPLLAFATARPLGGQLADLDVRSEADVQCDGGCRRTGALSIGLWLQTADSGRSECGRSCERQRDRSEEHTSELQSLMRISYAVFCLKKKQQSTDKPNIHNTHT